ncbi:hypothetical protein [Algoriphagus formosus]|uniref:hypothetical protein n=1 Tax=Algoriphagus formosus TaxID=2007308 RepID=UPI000C29522D|nr:hypothetical protein [Algoriphagus formosus]
MKNTLLRLFTIIWLSFLGFDTQAQNSKKIINSDLLTEYGISPKALDAALSTTLQKGEFTQKMEVSRTLDGKTESSNFYLIYDPTYKEGIDIQLAFNEDSISILKQKLLLKTMQEMHSFSRLSKENLYDEKSLKVISNEGNTIIISYRYNKSMLEPELMYAKKLLGKIYIVDGQLEKVELTNEAPIKFMGQKVEAENVISTTYFTRTQSHDGYIVKSTDQKYNYQKKKDRVEVIIKGTTVEYKDEDGVALSWPEKTKPFTLDSSAKTLTGSLGWGLPIYGKGARKLGYSLPRPIGINIFSHQQAQQLQFTDLQVGSNESDLVSLVNLFELEGSTVDQFTKVTMIKGDVWLLPFLNVMGVFGQGKNQIDGSLFLSEEVKDALSKLGWIIGLDPDDIPDYLPIQSELTALTYGGGVTLAGGVDNINVSLSYQFVASSIPEVNTTKLAHVLAPSLGYMTNFGMNVMIGAQGQFYNTNTKGFIGLPNDNNLNYQVNFKPIRWNFIAGLYVPISNHLELAVQSGWGQRRSLTFVFGYRF